ncbi:MAG: citrulline utilization hydrolase CtlX [Saprospiraceae bacterium]
MINQITDTILMVRPRHFGFNEETAANNAFQVNDQSITKEQISEKAIEEFDNFVTKLRMHGVDVIVAEDSETPIKTDSIFPNNWVTFHQDGTIILYPMNSLNRRLERSKDVLNTVLEKHHHRLSIDLSKVEEEELFLEGTGSLILDRPNGLAYACVSPRTNEEILDIFCKKMDYQKILFSSSDQNGQLIYHTNVMMALAENFVIICMESIDREEDRDLLIKKFGQTGKEVISINYAQMYAFAGNMLQVKNRIGETFLVMSEQAFKSLDKEQIHAIQRHTSILHSPIYTIEKYGGGSARCMMAEVFLPRK